MDELQSSFRTIEEVVGLHKRNKDKTKSKKKSEEGDRKRHVVTPDVAAEFKVMHQLAHDLPVFVFSNLKKYQI